MKRESIFLEMELGEGHLSNGELIAHLEEDGREYAIVNTINMGRVLLCHGDKIGRLRIDDDILFAHNFYRGIDKIVCCHPKEVTLFYEIIFPDIGNKVFFPEHNSLVFSQAVVVEDKILMEVMSFQSIVDN